MAHAALENTADSDEASPSDCDSGDGGAGLKGLARLAAIAVGCPAVVILDVRGPEPRIAATSSAGALPDAALSLPVEALASGSDQVRVPDAGNIRVAPVVSPSGETVGGVLLVGLEEPTEESRRLLADIVDAAAAHLCVSARLGGEPDLARALAESRGNYRLMTETVEYAIGVLAIDGTIAEVNGAAAEVLGDAPERIIGRQFQDFVAPEDLERAVQEFGSRLAGDAARRETEIRIVRPDGNTRLLQVRSTGILADGALVGVYFTARDATDERAHATQLRRAERLASIAPLLSGVCHELNNPLTSIKSFAELMLLDERPSDDQEALEIIKREATRAGRIVSDLRMVARQTQEEGASATALDLNELVRHICYEMGDEFVAADVEVIFELGPELPYFFGVRPQIERVLRQLLANAVQALRAVASVRRITLQSTASADGVTLGIADTGPGIEPEHLEHIFDPFWTTQATGSGTGLGLSLAHSVITDHHGEIRVDGGWGRGATFTVELPTMNSAARPGRELSVQTPARTPLRLLIVDDEGPIRYSLARYMERRGHTVCDAAEGEAALALLDRAGEAPFDVILADLRMPGLDGEELFARLKGRPDRLADRLIFITGDAESPDAARLLEEAGVPVVLKPFDLAEIAQIIEVHAGVAGG
ncbi:MAG: ATP-binding protein [Gemmatimonadota bacterium]